MKFKIVTDEKEECKKALDEFIEGFREEWEERVKRIHFLPPKMNCGYYEEDNSIILEVPFKVPRVMGYIGRWKGKLERNLKGFLKEKGVGFEEVKYVGD